MHAGYPMIDNMIALMGAMLMCTLMWRACLGYLSPSKHYIKRLVQAGFETHMYGTDLWSGQSC
jgi:hypothetical protein